MQIELVTPASLYSSGSPANINWRGGKGLLAVAGSFTSFCLESNGQAGPAITEAGTYVVDIPAGPLAVAEVTQSSLSITLQGVDGYL